MEEKNEVFVATQYTGPIPPSQELIRYNEACPNAADRIIAMAERQAQHRQEMEKKDADNKMKLYVWSMVCSILCVFMLSGVICYAIYSKSIGTTIAACITAIAGVAGLFFCNRRLAKDKSSH